MYSVFKKFSTLSKLYILFLINSSICSPNFANVFSITVKIRQFQDFSLMCILIVNVYMYVALHNSIYGVLIISRINRRH